MKAFTCSSLSPPWGGSRALALALRAPRISSWPTRSLPCAASRSPSGVGRAHQPKAHTWWTRALQARPIIRLGLSNTACGGFARQNVTAHGPGPSGFAAGWRGSARWSRLSMTSSPTRSGSIAHARMPLVVFRRAWPPRSPYTISVSGSMSNLAGLVWPLQTWWTGKLTFHTKRLKGATMRDCTADSDITAGAIVSNGDNGRYEFHVGDGIAFLQNYPFHGGELVYCDPPYLHSTRRDPGLYRYEMTDYQHEALLAVLLRLPCLVCISGYWSELYADTLRTWRVCSFQAPATRGVMRAE